MAQLARYLVGDVPASTWDAILCHIRDPADAALLAGSARGRLLYRYAIPLYRHAADAGGEDAARQLADLLAERGDLDGLRARANARREPVCRFVATRTMPAGLRQFAEYQPFTPVTETLRGLLAGGPIGSNAMMAVACGVGIAVLSYLWARRLYRRPMQAK